MNVTELLKLSYSIGRKLEKVAVNPKWITEAAMGRVGKGIRRGGVPEVEFLGVIHHLRKLMNSKLDASKKLIKNPDIVTKSNLITPTYDVPKILRKTMNADKIEQAIDKLNKNKKTYLSNYN